MTICSQNLLPEEKQTLERMRQEDPTVDRQLAEVVKVSIAVAGGGPNGALQQEIDIRTRDLINPTRATVSNIIDQSFNRQLTEVVDKAITAALAEKADQFDQFRSEIERVVQKAVDTKLNDLKNKALAPTKKNRRK